MYVEDIDDATNLQINVIKLLEADAKKNGLSRIFCNIDNSDFDLYSLLGYTETDKIDNDRVTQLGGAIVTFDITMIKQL